MKPKEFIESVIKELDLIDELSTDIKYNYVAEQFSQINAALYRELVDFSIATYQAEVNKDNDAVAGEFNHKAATHRQVIKQFNNSLVTLKILREQLEAEVKRGKTSSSNS